MREKDHFLSMVYDCELCYVNSTHYSNFFVRIPKTVRGPPTTGNKRNLPMLILSTLMLVREISGQMSMQLLHIYWILEAQEHWLTA